MASKLNVATRKGLFTFEQYKPGDWRVAQTAFIGEPVTIVLSDPRNGDRYAALNLGHFGVKLHRAEAGGDWREIATPKFPRNEDGAEGASVAQLWALSPSGADRAGTLWAGTIPGGLFKSEDRGESWRLIESLWNRPERAQWFGGGYDQPGIHSICVDPRDSDRLLVAVSCGGVWESRDDGDSWQLLGEGLRAAFMPPERAYDPTVQDPHYLACCPAKPDMAWIQHHNGIFRSNDGGRTWREIVDVKPSSFGFAVAVHPSDPNTAWFVPATKDECRVPVDGKLVVTRTRDGGNSFDILDRGLPGEHAYDIVLRHALDVDPTGDVLAFGSTTGNLWLSADQGDHWQCLSMNLPPINAVRFEP
jgi:hypothetical protein